MVLNLFRFLLKKTKTTNPGTPSLEIRPIFPSSESIDVLQCGTYGAFHGLAGAQ